MGNLNEIIQERSNSLIDRRIKTSNSLIEGVLRDNEDIIEEQWVRRHAKFCYKKGIPAYIELVTKARKYGKNPTSLLAFLVNQEIGR